MGICHFPALRHRWDNRVKTHAKWQLKRSTLPVASNLWVGTNWKCFKLTLNPNLFRALEDSGARITEEELDTLIFDYYRLRGWKPVAGCKVASGRPVLKSTIFNHCYL